MSKLAGILLLAALCFVRVQEQGSQTMHWIRADTIYRVTREPGKTVVVYEAAGSTYTKWTDESPRSILKQIEACERCGS